MPIVAHVLQMLVIILLIALPGGHHEHKKVQKRGKNDYRIT